LHFLLLQFHRGVGALEVEALGQFARRLIDGIAHFLHVHFGDDVKARHARTLSKTTTGVPETGTPVHVVVGRDGFEPSKAMPTGLQPVPFGHSGTDPGPEQDSHLLRAIRNGIGPDDRSSGPSADSVSPWK